MKTYILTVIGLIVLLGSCKKEVIHTPTPVKELYLNGDKSFLINYFHFKKGTYWVYKDSISQISDTVRVIKSFRELVDDTPQYTDTLLKYEATNYVMCHSHSPYKSVFQFNAAQPIVIYHSELPTYTLYHFTDIDNIYVDSEKTFPRQSKRISSEKPVSVGSFNFAKGIETPWFSSIRQHSFDYDPNHTNFKITYAKDVGIVKRSIQNDTLHQVWELVDYKIVR